MKKISYKNLILSTLCLLILFLSTFPLTALAGDINEAYLNSEYWNSCESEIVRFNFGSNKPKGACCYAKDEVNNIAYFKLNFSSPIDFEYLRIHFTINDGYNEYQFSIDKDGMCDILGNEAELFEVLYSFTNSPIIAIKFNNGSYVNHLMLSIYSNDRIFNILDDVTVDATLQTTVKTTIPKTTKSTTTKTLKEKTTKVHTTKVKVTKQHTTKYTPNAQYVITTTEISTTESTTQANDNNATDVNHTNFLNNRKGFIIAGVVLIVISLCFLVYHIMSKKNKPLDE